MMLSEHQVASFHENGFLHVPGVLEPGETEQLRATTDRLVAERDHLDEINRSDLKYGTLVGDKRVDGGDYLWRIEYSFAKDRQYFLVAGHPKVLAIAWALRNGTPTNGPLVITWEDIVVKTPGAGFGFRWHQDNLYQCVHGIVISVGVYLDDSGSDPLLVVPGSHKLGRLYPDQVKRIVHVSEPVGIQASAGDVIVHNVRIIHGSNPNESHDVRRVLYLEFRSADQVRDDSPWSPQWLLRRLPYIPSAFELRRRSELGLRDDAELVSGILEEGSRWMPDVAPQPFEDLDRRVWHGDVVYEQ